MVDDSVVFGRACVNHPELTVSVGKTPMRTFRVVFRDSETGSVIETRVFDKCMSAYAYAQRLINKD